MLAWNVVVKVMMKDSIFTKIREQRISKPNKGISVALIRARGLNLIPTNLKDYERNTVQAQL